MVFGALVVPACSKSDSGKAAGDKTGEAAKGDDASAADGSKGLAPQVLEAKYAAGACGLVSAAAVQKALGLAQAPTTEAGTADKPSRAYCRFSWTADDQPRHLDVAWASSLAGNAEKISKGKALADEDVAQRRLQSVDLPGVWLSTWGEGWLTIYANDSQVVWVIMDDAGLTARAGKAAALAIGTALVSS